jgi:type IV pilus assembly protein PilB
VELRISVFPTVRGEKIVIRLFDPSNRSFELSALGFDEDTLKTFVHLLTRPSGLLLLTGPTGSGKTTAIYSALYHIVQRNGPAVSISTVEDPVEFNLPMISQAQINPAQDFTLPQGPAVIDATGPTSDHGWGNSRSRDGQHRGAGPV